MARLAAVQKFYAWGMMGLGIAPLTYNLLWRLITKEDGPPGIDPARLLAEGLFAIWLMFLGIFMIACAVSAGATAISSALIAQGKHPAYCRAVAVLNLLYFPFGTALGVLTLLTLARRRSAGC